MANTYTLIASNTLSSTATSVVFNSIPQTYTDLCLRISARTDATGADSGYYLLTVNNIVTFDFAHTGIQQAVSTASTVTNSGMEYMEVNNPTLSAGNTTNVFSFAEVFFPRYTSSTYKSHLYQDASMTNRKTIQCGSMLNTQAITKLTIDSPGGNLIVGCTFDLYGIKN